MKKQGNNWPLLIAVTILAAVIIRIPHESMRDGFEFAFRCAAIFLFSAALYENVNKHVGIFLLLALASHSLTIFYITGFKAINTPESLSALQMAVIGCGFYAIVVLKCHNHDVILDIICLICFIQFSFLVLRYAKINPYNFMGLKSVLNCRCGITANPNEAGALAALCLPAFFRHRWKKFLLIPIIALLLSKSFGGMLGFVFAVIAFAGIHGHKFWPGVLISVGAISYAVFIKAPSVSSRSNAWGAVIAMCLNKSPLLGCGFGNWERVFLNLIEAKQLPKALNGFSRLHSTYVQGYVEIGVAFPLLLLSYIVDILKRINNPFRNIKDIAVYISGVAAVAGCMIPNSLFRMNAFNAMIAIAWLAMLEAKLREA